MSSFSHVVAVGPWMALLNTDRAESARDWGFNTVNRQSIKLDSSPCNGYLIRNELMEAAAVPSKCPSSCSVVHCLTFLQALLVCHHSQLKWSNFSTRE